MTSPSLLLALAPAATVVATRTMAAAQSAGESFASVFSDLLQSDPVGASKSSQLSEDNQGATTLSESFQSLAEKFRGWLREQGASEDYSVQYHLAADGEASVEVSGADSEQVEQLLASDTSWLSKLRQLAASVQAESAHRNSGSDLSSVTMEIGPTDSTIY